MPPQPPRELARPARRRAPTVLGFLFALLLLLGVGGVGAYWFLLRYEPTAHRHVPTGSTLAMRVDFQDIALFGPVRRHLWPLAFEQGERGVDPSAEASFASRVEAATGLNLERDIRELVLVNAGATDSGKWLVILGGKIPGGVVKALANDLGDDGEPGWASYDASQDILVVRPFGVAVGQAEDRTLIIASDRATLALALPDQDGARAIGLPDQGALSFAVSASAWSEWSSGLTATLIPPLRTLSKLHGCNGRFTLGDKPELEMQCRLASAVDPGDVRDSLLSLVSALRGMSALVGGADQLGERRALADLRIEALEDGRVRLIAPWPLEGLERGAETLARKIRGLRMLTSEPPAPTRMRLPSLPELPSLPVPLPGLPSPKAPK